MLEFSWSSALNVRTRNEIHKLYQADDQHHMLKTSIESTYINERVKQTVIWQVRLKYLYKMYWLQGLNKYSTTHFKTTQGWNTMMLLWQYSDMKLFQKILNAKYIVKISFYSDKLKKMAKNVAKFTKWLNVFFHGQCTKWRNISKLAMKCLTWQACSTVTCGKTPTAITWSENCDYHVIGQWTMLYCFIWLSQQTGALQEFIALSKPTTIVNIRANENAMTQWLISINKEGCCVI